MEYQQMLFDTMQATGLPESYLLNTPQAFWTREAFNLFQAAREAGIIAWIWQADKWDRGPGISRADQLAQLNRDLYRKPRPITKGQLAYFCKNACRRLHLNKGAQTQWEPFEEMFGFKPKTMRGYLHNVEERSDSGKLEDPGIDAFFKSVIIYDSLDY